jgi:hypothetical protein
MRPQEPADSGEPEVVHSVYTQTSVYVGPDGERFPYFNLIAIMQGGRKINLLFNPALTAGLIQDMGKMFMTMTGAMDAETVDTAMDQPIDWDNMPPAPPDPNDDDYQEPPDRYGDR